MSTPMPTAAAIPAITPIPAITRYPAPCRRRGRRPYAFYAYLVAVNDDGYPVEEPAPTDRPRVIRPASLRQVKPGRAQADLAREARIRWHSLRIARRE